MDWSNERYVRLYVRDTADILAIGWEGRLVWYELLRHVDRAGVLDHGGDIEIVPELLRVPADIFERGLARLRRRRCVRITSTAIVVPNFLEAQDTPATDAHRMRELRARRRELAMRAQPPDEKQLSLDSVTPALREQGETVTRCSPVPCRTVPDPAEPPLPPMPPDRAPARVADHVPEEPADAGGGGGGGVVSSPVDTTRAVVRQFFRSLLEDDTWEPSDQQVSAWSELVERHAERHTPEELVAVAWEAGRHWSSSKRDEANPEWFLAGKRPIERWLALAEKRWRAEESKTDPPPWARGEPNGSRPIARAS